MNHIDLIGRLTADPETRTVSDSTCTTFTLAVQRNYTPKGKEKETDFINCVAWRHTGEFIAKYFYKGRMMGVSGEMHIRQYTTRDGDKRTATEVVVDNAFFCDDKRNTGGPSYVPDDPANFDDPNDPIGFDLPF